MRDVTTIDWSKAHAKIRSLNPGTQKVFFTQDGIEYDAGGKACNAKQVKEYYASIAADAQQAADEAKDAAASAQAAADEMLKQAGINKTIARKAAS